MRLSKYTQIEKQYSLLVKMWFFADGSNRGQRKALSSSGQKAVEDIDNTAWLRSHMHWAISRTSRPVVRNIKPHLLICSGI
jgi:fido (protein-threonine AMPylation protein)